MTQVLQKFEPLLQGIAAAVKDEGLRAQIEPVLAGLEQNGWRPTEAGHRIWAGTGTRRRSQTASMMRRAYNWFVEC